ncbi:c-type cytochrome [Bradyrhizobium sp. RDT10]
MVREGDNRLGPNLHNIIGRKAGSLPDYGFSSAMKEAGFVWDEEKLDRFIANPDEVVPGNSMKPYGGLPSSDDRKRSSPSLHNRGNAYLALRAEVNARSIACVTITAERSSR